MTRRLTRIAPLQAGKDLGVPYVIGGAMVAIGVFLPIVYAVMGFVFGILGATVYNLIARWVGGFEVEVE